MKRIKILQLIARLFLLEQIEVTILQDGETLQAMAVYFPKEG